MKQFTKKWDDYIKCEWKDYLFPKTISVIYPSEIYNGSFSKELLNEEFENYYDAKKRYSSMYETFEKEFGDYEQIELLSKEEEYQRYVKTINNQAKHYKDEFIKKINEYSKNDFENYKINSLEKFNIEDADFKLLALGKVNIKTRDIYRKSMPQYSLIISTENTDKLYDVIFNININKFLTSYEEFFCDELNYKKNILYIDELSVAYYDEYKILNFNDENNCVKIELLNYDDTIIKLVFENTKIINNFFKCYDINKDEICITKHYIKKYDDCYNGVFQCVARSFKNNELVVKEETLEITYKNLKISTFSK